MVRNLKNCLTLNSHLLQNGVQILLDLLLGLGLLSLLGLLLLRLLLHNLNDLLDLLHRSNLGMKNKHISPTVSVSAAKSSFRVSVQGIPAVR